MIKTRQIDTPQPDAVDDGKKSFVCWSKDAQAQCLRVELSNGSFLIFPYTHLSFAKMEREENQDILSISFTTHDLHMTGKNLYELGIALQKLSVDWIKEAPARYATLAARDTVFIGSIEVNEIVGQALS